MKAALVCVLVMASVLLAKGGTEFCGLEIPQIREVEGCMRGKIPAELKQKISGFHKEGLEVPEYIKKHCDAGSDFATIFKSAFTDDEIATLKSAYHECHTP